MNLCRHSIQYPVIATAVAFFAACSLSSGQQFFTDRAAFLANVQPGFDEEKFDGWSTGDPLDGHQAEWEASAGGEFSLVVSASGAGNHQLYSLNGAISTSSYNDALAFQFTGNPVYAFGGDFWGTQFDGFPQTTELQFETDNGVLTHTVSGPSFIGFISNAPLTGVLITTSGSQAAWSTADNLVTGDLKHDGDLDGDGMTNYDERFAGTDPADPRSTLRIISVALADSTLVITFPAVTGKTYRLEYQTALTETNWFPAPVTDISASATGPAHFIHPTSPSETRFYRVRLIHESSKPPATFSPGNLIERKSEAKVFRLRR